MWLRNRHVHGPRLSREKPVHIIEASTCRYLPEVEEGGRVCRKRAVEGKGSLGEKRWRWGAPWQR